MPRLISLIAIVAIFTVASPAYAVIKVLTPLKQVLDSCDPIIVVEVDKVDAEKKATVLKFVENLKGKSPAEKFTINLAGNGIAKKEGHTQVILDRLAPGRKMVLFFEKVNNDYIVRGFVEGTWITVHGVRDGEVHRYAFENCEPYFRRTFKGTTEELKTVIVESLTGKRKPPEPNEKEPHGYGPPVEKPKEEKKEDKKDKKEQSSLTGGPLFGVIPSFLVVGPIAVLSALFPALFAGLASGLKRWRGFMMVTTVNSLLSCAYMLLQERSMLPNTSLLSPLAVSAYILTSTIIGIAWTGRRYRRAVAEDATVTEPPGSNEFVALIGGAGVMFFVIAMIVWCVPAPWLSTLAMPMRELSSLVVGLLVASGYSLYRTLTKSIDTSTPRMSAPGETIGLLGVFTFILALTVYDYGRGKQSNTSINVEAAGDTEIQLLDAEILYENKESNIAMSGVTVTSDRIYLGSMKINRGIITCIDRTTGKQIWMKTGVKMRAIYSTPTVVGDRLYVGEGTHGDEACRLMCLSINEDKSHWEFPTLSHTEGNPHVENGKVYFSAGDDGIYCVDIQSGEEAWHFVGKDQKLHIDSSVTVVDDKLYAGSGYYNLIAFALDAKTGKFVWKRDISSRSFGQPIVDQGKVYFGLGTGRLSEDLNTEDEEGKPRETTASGTVLCLNTINGETIWKRDLNFPVHTNLGSDAVAVYAACRDGWLYALSKRTGEILWKFSYGTPLTSGPVVAMQGEYPQAVYCVSMDGQVFCHRASDGKVIWARNIREVTNRPVEILTTPTLVTVGNKRELYVHVTLTNPNGQKIPALIRFTDGPK